MSMKDYLHTVITNILRNKKNISYIVVLLICTVLSLGVFIFKDNLQMSNDILINNNIGYRTMNIYPKTDKEDFGQNELLSIEHVVGAYSSQYHKVVVDTNLKDKDMDGIIELQYATGKTLPTIIDGRTFEKGETNVAICPVNFYPDSKTILNIDDNRIINGKDLLDKEITIEYFSHNLDEEWTATPKDKYEEKYKIIGLYNNEQVMNYNNQCFVPSQDIIRIIDTMNLDDDMTIFGINVIVDNLENVESVAKKAEELGFKNIFLVNEINFSLIQFINIAFIITLSIVLFTVILISTSYIKKKIISEEKNIGVLRAIGYSKKVIKNVCLFEVIIINTIVFIIGLILCNIVFLNLKDSTYNTFKYLGINLTIKLSSLIIPFMVIVIVSTLATLYQLNKKSRLEITKLLGDEE